MSNYISVDEAKNIWEMQLNPSCEKKKKKLKCCIQQQLQGLYCFYSITPALGTVAPLASPGTSDSLPVMLQPGMVANLSQGW